MFSDQVLKHTFVALVIILIVPDRVGINLGSMLISSGDGSLAAQETLSNGDIAGSRRERAWT